MRNISGFSAIPRLLLAACLSGMLTTTINARTASDLKRDLTSKPQAVLEFVDVQPGDQVLDLFGGGGYYSELLAPIVGQKGHIVLHNNHAYIPFVGKELGARMANSRLKNITQLMSEANSLKLGTNRFDVVFFVLGYHDLYVSSKDWQVSADQVIPQVFSSLKEGGKLLVIDHSAIEKKGSADAQSLHRIEENFVLSDLAKRGFKLLKQSKILKNPDDPLNINVFDTQIRRQTDRFVLLFQKTSAKTPNKGNK